MFVANQSIDSRLSSSYWSKLLSHLLVLQRGHRDFVVFSALMSRNAGSDENGRFDEISSNWRWANWRFLCKLFHQRYPWHVGEFDDFGDFYANYVTRDIPDILAIFGDFYANYVTSDIPDILTNLAIFMQIMSPEISLTFWRIWRFLCKLCHQRYSWHVGEFDDFGDSYANYVTRDIPDMLANLAILAIFM